MKVVVTGTRGIPNIMGGVETHCEELFPRLAEKGIDITVIRRKSYVTGNPNANKDVVNGVWEGVKLIDIKTPKKKSFEAIIHTFRAVNKAKDLGAEIVHIHAIGPALVTPYAKLLGLKVVFTHHGPDYDRDKWGLAAKTMLKLGEWCGCKFADHVVVISDVIKNLIAKRCGRTKNVHLIYNGVTTPEFCEENEYFSSLGIEENQYILGMCRFVPEKRLHDLVEAYIQLKQTWKKDFNQELPYKLVLAGDTDFEDEYSRKLKELAKKNGVVLTGFIKGRRLHAILTHASCYCLPSSHEGLPIALLEAMSYNLPVIVSNIPANLEVRLNETCYFPCGNVDILKDKLYSTLLNNEKRIEYDLSKYDWNHISEQVLKIYQN